MKIIVVTIAINKNVLNALYLMNHPVVRVDKFIERDESAPSINIFLFLLYFQ